LVSLPYGRGHEPQQCKFPKIVIAIALRAAAASFLLHDGVVSRATPTALEACGHEKPADGYPEERARANNTVADTPKIFATLELHFADHCASLPRQ